MNNHEGIHVKDITSEELYELFINVLIERIAKVLIEAKERKNND